MHLTRARALLTGAALLLAAAAPTAHATLVGADSSVPERGASYVETQLFFGTERPDGGQAVSDRQFMAFVDKEVTPGFPKGLTVQSGAGSGGT